jgi:hypothetical protein
MQRPAVDANERQALTLEEHERVEQVEEDGLPPHLRDRVDGRPVAPAHPGRHRPRGAARAP